MIRLAILAAALALTGCDDGPASKSAAPEPYDDMRLVSAGASWVYVYHDDRREVTCWSTRHGLSCLPDSALARDGGAL